MLTGIEPLSALTETPKEEQNGVIIRVPKEGEAPIVEPLPKEKEASGTAAQH